MQMISDTNSMLIILVELIFGLLAIFTQRAALRSDQDALVHAIAWAVEVLVSSAAFFILAIFSTSTYAITGFIVGIIIIALGSFLLYLKVSD